MLTAMLFFIDISLCYKRVKLRRTKKISDISEIIDKG